MLLILARSRLQMSREDRGVRRPRAPIESAKKLICASRLRFEKSASLRTARIRSARTTRSRAYPPIFAPSKDAITSSRFGPAKDAGLLYSKPDRECRDSYPLLLAPTTAES